MTSGSPSGLLAVNDIRAQNATALLIFAALANNHVVISNVRICNEALSAIQNPLAVFQFGCTFLTHVVRSAARFGNRQTANFCAGSQCGQIFLLLRLSTVNQYGFAGQMVCHQCDGKTSRITGYFFQTNGTFDMAHAYAAVLFGNKYACNAELTCFRP
ncbi:hypothetical protein SDC9_120539 [bioreactor metagenome]|uniref:Uncharacterized protein n=1 Tax=bioreactor metagenome TaxID=1076179 RepID=A0A645C857_9ZZZZ